MCTYEISAIIVVYIVIAGEDDLVTSGCYDTSHFGMGTGTAVGRVIEYRCRITVELL
jgi:hypothetical protein